MARCAECNMDVGGWIPQVEAVEFPKGFTLCFACSKDPAVIDKHRGYKTEERPQINITLTTETYLGDLVIKRLEIIASEYVLGVNVLRDFKSAFTNIIGGRSAGLKTLR